MTDQTTLTDEELAAAIKTWRGDVSGAKAAPYLGLSRRTLEGIEQGRGFRHQGLLLIAMELVDPTKPLKATTKRTAK